MTSSGSSRPGLVAAATAARTQAGAASRRPDHLDGLVPFVEEVEDEVSFGRSELDVVGVLDAFFDAAFFGWAFPGPAFVAAAFFAAAG